MELFLFMMAGFMIVLFILPIIPHFVSMKGKMIMAVISLLLAAVLLTGSLFLAFWQSALIYTFLTLTASYAVGVYGFPKWAVEGAYTEKDQNAAPFAEEADLTEKDELVMSKTEPAVEQNTINKEVPVVDEQVYQPVEESIQPELNLGEWEPESVEEIDDEPLEVMEKESQKDHLFDEDEYITALYSDEEEWNDSMQEDKIAENGQSDYLAELLSEMEEAETQQEDEMDELPLLDLESSKKRTDIE